MKSLFYFILLLSFSKGVLADPECSKYPSGDEYYDKPCRAEIEAQKYPNTYNKLLSLLKEIKKTHKYPKSIQDIHDSVIYYHNNLRGHAERSCTLIMFTHLIPGGGGSGAADSENACVKEFYDEAVKIYTEIINACEKEPKWDLPRCF